MNTYYEVKGTIDGETEILFGSYVRGDCAYELDAERDSWKDQGYRTLHIEARETDEEPDLDVYADDQCDLCGKVDELGHNDATGLALCCKCDNENQDDDDITSITITAPVPTFTSARAYRDYRNGVTA